MTDLLSLTAFLARLQSRFQLPASRAETTELALVQAVNHGSTHSQERFSLLFRG